MIWVIKVALLVYVGFGALLYVAQRGFMYMPVAENLADDLPHERIAVDGATLKVWVVDPGNGHAVIYFGGNAEDVYYNAADFHRHLPGTSVYLVNYRGYGGSTGSPSEAALFADALQLFDLLNQRHGRVSVIGRSLGSGVATYLAAERPVDRVVLITPQDSAAAIAKRLYPVYPVDWMLKDRYDSVVKAPRITAPVQVVIGADDRIIPPEHSERLLQAFAHQPVEKVVIEGAGHNDISGVDAYWQAIAAFLAPRPASAD
jgi:pimeloyl-ACP methyl ester carboxylesterase